MCHTINPAPDAVWCAIPVFNHGATVREVAMACRAELPRVVVVDDGSTDMDVGALFRHTDLDVLRHPRNQGKGRALLTALRHVHAHGGRTLITLDADGQHQPADIRSLLPAIAADPDALVIGVRRMDGPDVPAASRMGMRLSNFWVERETGVPVRDSQSGFRAYPVESILRLPLHGRRYEFETEILVKALWAGMRVQHVDVNVTYAVRGSPRNSHFRMCADNLRIIGCHAPLIWRSLWARKRRARFIPYRAS